DLHLHNRIGRVGNAHVHQIDAVGAEGGVQRGDGIVEAGLLVGRYRRAVGVVQVDIYLARNQLAGVGDRLGIGGSGAGGGSVLQFGARSLNGIDSQVGGADERRRLGAGELAGLLERVHLIVEGVELIDGSRVIGRRGIEAGRGAIDLGGKSIAVAAAQGA